MKTVKVQYSTDNTTDSPSIMHLNIDIEDFYKLKWEIEQYEELIAIRPFKITILLEVYMIDTEKEFFTIREGDGELLIYPEKDKSYLDWRIVQKLEHKHSSDVYLVSEGFTLRGLAEHFNVEL